MLVINLPKHQFQPILSQTLHQRLNNKLIKKTLLVKIKHSKFLPGSNIHIVDEDFAKSNPPNYFLLTAWNYKDEIIKKVRESGNLDSIFIVPFPSPHFV